MGSYRDRLQIIADILQITSEGAKKTQIMYQANLSYKLLCRYLGEVVDSGLVDFNSDAYLLTPKGKEFLSTHDEYSKNCKEFEDHYNHINDAKIGLEKMCWNGKTQLNGLASLSRRKTASKAAQTSMKGVVLAAGEGSRIRKVTYGAYPKELLPIGNVPTIRFPIEALRLAGVKDILVVIAPQTKHGIIDGLQSGERLGVKLSYVVQEKTQKGLSGLGQAILSTRGRIESDQDFVVACGDSILCDFSSSDPLNCVSSLLRVHKKSDAIATLMVHPTKADPTRFGVIKFRSLSDEEGVLHGEVDQIVEKPNWKTASEFILNGYCYIAVGYYVFKPKIFSYIEKTEPGARNEVQITDAIALALEKGERVNATVHARNNGKDLSPCEYWDVGIPEDYKEANKRFLVKDLDSLLT